MEGKAYGKLTEDQFRRLIKKVPEIRSMGEEFKAAVRSASRAKLRESLGGAGCWAWIYELPFAQHVAFVIVALGQKDWLGRVATAPDPQEEVLRAFDDVSDVEWEPPEDGSFSIGDVLLLTSTLQRTVLSIMLFKRSLSALLQEARSGDDSALFSVIRVDRSAVACPTIANRIAHAEFLQDKHFFDHLRNALKGPRNKHWESYRELRYALFTLRELGFDSLSDKELEHLLVDVLGVYPKTAGARKNLRQQYYESKRIKAL